MIAQTLISARLLQYAGALVLYGSPLFFLYGTPAPPAAAGLNRWRWERRLLFGAALVALAGVLVWLMAETVAMSGDPADAAHASALWMVASETRFGLACCVRIALLLLAVGACFAISSLKVLWWVHVALGAAITMSFAWTGHGAAEMAKTSGIHLAGDLLHLLAASIWIGALVPLGVLGLRASRSGAIEDAQVLQFALRAFSRVGVWVVAVLVFSGIINSLYLIDVVHWREALNSAYGQVLCVKLALFGGMAGLAVLNRYRTSPALDDALARRASLAPALSAARSTLWLETGLAALVLAAVSVLGTLPPPDVQAGASNSEREPLRLT
jgi:putative copper resistance protein D